MSLKLMSGATAAAWLVCGLVAGAQAPDQKSDAAVITVAGCVQPEASVLKRPAIARNIGMGDEFVLTRSMLAKGTSSMDRPPTEAAPPPAETAGTSGSAGNFGKVYRVTGQKENELKPYVGQRVEVTGTFKHDEDAKAELGAVGTSGRAVSGELTPENTPEITIVSIRAVPGACVAGAVR
jgi:hypothetical protein